MREPSLDAIFYRMDSGERHNQLSNIMRLLLSMRKEDFEMATNLMIGVKMAANQQRYHGHMRQSPECPVAALWATHVVSNSLPWCSVEVTPQEQHEIGLGGESFKVAVHTKTHQGQRMVKTDATQFAWQMGEWVLGRGMFTEMVSKYSQMEIAKNAMRFYQQRLMDSPTITPYIYRVNP